MKKLFLYPLIIMFCCIPYLSGDTGDRVSIFGYFSLNIENVGKAPAGIDGLGNTFYEDPTIEYAYPHFDIMFMANPTDRLKIFVDIGYLDSDSLGLVNYFGEYTFSDSLKLSFGKILRPFGLFNENLQAVPTYLGIEPPELLDKDHLMLQRSTAIMVSGTFFLDRGSIRYSVSTDQGEAVNEYWPVGWDLRWEYEDILTIGHSGYYSGQKSSTRSVGEGSPRGGIKPWMDHDTFTVLGLFAQLELSNFTLKTAFWTASHDAVRDPSAVAKLAAEAGLNETQMDRFGLGAYNPGDMVPLSAVTTDVNYNISTFYIRLGYQIDLPNNSGSITPYVFMDFYKNPESIENKTYGGDGEAGQADDGKFSKPTLGFVYRPNLHWAIKVDGSSHIYQFNGENAHYEEIRFDVSYFFN